jgi:MOSC domain-containing protein YiiM
MSHRVVSVCAGKVRSVAHAGRKVRTGIFKAPLAGPVRVTRLGLEGDGQADRRFHGGPDMALYAFPAAHYPRFRAELGRDLEPGQFGENLTVEGPAEDAVRVGDEFLCGTARVQVVKPRGPCFKLGIRVGDDAFLPRFHDAGLWGYYLRVLEEGSVAAGDPWRLLRTDPAARTVADVIAEKLRKAAGTA